MLTSDLLTLPPAYEGEIHFAYSDPDDPIQYARITRSWRSEVTVDDFVPFDDPIYGEIRKKCHKTYTTSHPKELLAYYSMHPPVFSLKNETDRVKTFIQEAVLQMPDPFTRVWVYHPETRSIIISI